MSTEKMYEFEGKTLTRNQMFERAHQLLDNIDRFLLQSFDNCSRKVAELKAAAPGTLSEADQKILNAQLAHEQRTARIQAIA